jgi:hypothetical protein
MCSSAVADCFQFFPFVFIPIRSLLAHKKNSSARHRSNLQESIAYTSFPCQADRFSQKKASKTLPTRLRGRACLTRGIPQRSPMVFGPITASRPDSVKKRSHPIRRGSTRRPAPATRAVLAAFCRVLLLQYCSVRIFLLVFFLICVHKAYFSIFFGSHNHNLSTNIL